MVKCYRFDPDSEDATKFLCVTFVMSVYITKSKAETAKLTWRVLWKILSLFFDFNLLFRVPIKLIIISQIERTPETPESIAHVKRAVSQRFQSHSPIFYEA